MKNIEEIVHIIPLGYEVDRAVKPFESLLKANRVYLLTMVENPKYSHEMNMKQKKFLEIVRKNLEEKGIEVQIKNVDMFDMLDVMMNVANIIRIEKAKNNIVYVNMSACGRLTSVAATLAGMARKAKIYYVMADRYSQTESEEAIHGLSICERPKPNIVQLENFEFVEPDDVGLQILVQLCQKEMKSINILDFLRQTGIKGFRPQDFSEKYRHDKRRMDIACHIRLDKGILEKLKEKKYIEKERVGKYNKIRITETGKYVAHISGLLDAEFDVHNM